MSVKPGRLGELAWSGASNRNPTARTRVGRLRIGPVLAIVDAGNTVVYDNKMGASDDSNDGTVLGGATSRSTKADLLW